jgi:hypothetical protein
MSAPAPGARRVAEVETFAHMSPVLGVAAAPHLSVQEALDVAQAGETRLAGVNLAPFLYAARSFAADIDLADPAEPLSDAEDVVALHIYTAECPVYHVVNARLRDASATTCAGSSGLHRPTPAAPRSLAAWAPPLIPRAALQSRVNHTAGRSTTSSSSRCWRCKRSC